jgi:hypothetical protein
MHAITMPLAGEGIHLSAAPGRACLVYLVIRRTGRRMKNAGIVLLVILAVAACGCTAASPSLSSVSPAAPSATTLGTLAASPAMPDLTGNWTGPMEGYDEGVGYTTYPTFRAVMQVTEQHGRIFSGTFEFIPLNGTVARSEFAGAVGRDGRTLTLVEQAGGYCTGEILGPDEIELTYTDDNKPFSIAIDTFRRT